jgi:hypothetical protein
VIAERGRYVRGRGCPGRRLAEAKPDADALLIYSRAMSGAPFRGLGKASSPTLEALAAKARESRRELLHEAASLAPAARHKRLELAVGADLHDAGGWQLAALLAACLAFSTCAGGVAAESAGVILGSILVGAIFASIWAAMSERRKREREALVDQALRWTDEQGFPITGYADWLASEVPLLDVVFSAPLDRRFADAVHAVDAAIDVDFLDERTARLAIPPRVIRRGEIEHRVGDREAFARLTESLLRPLHSEVGLARVDMGGSMLRR